jgi:formate dehydrogenase iron-sulfur subunit
VKIGLLIDTTKCIGCGACTQACKETNELPKDDATTLSATTWTVVEKHNGVNVRRMCMHCEDPACASVCPVAALKKTPEGPVVYDETKCIGCRYCMVGCPFGIPRYEWSSAVPRMRKCILCYENATKNGQPTACASVCPTGATKFGERAELVREAQGRIQVEPERYHPRVFGISEVGGTSVLYLAGVDFAELGFRTGVRQDRYPQLTWNVLSRLPNVVSVAGAGLFGVWWLMNRREEVALSEAHDKPNTTNPSTSKDRG